MARNIIAEFAAILRNLLMEWRADPKESFAETITFRTTQTGFFNGVEIHLTW